MMLTTLLLLLFPGAAATDQHTLQEASVITHVDVVTAEVGLPQDAYQM